MRLIPYRRQVVPFSRFFESCFGDLAASNWYPPVDVKETENDVVVRAELPGVDPTEIEISVQGDLLTLRGEKSEEKESKDGNWHRLERRYGSFQRTFPLPCPVDPDKAAATAENGILTITLGKRDEDKTRRIDVQVK